jgi:hypothetical protein
VKCEQRRIETEKRTRKALKVENGKNNKRRGPHKSYFKDKTYQQFAGKTNDKSIDVMRAHHRY